jgi:3'-5' exoribonuclease
MKIIGIAMNTATRQTKNGSSYVTFDILIEGGERRPAKIWNTDTPPQENTGHEFTGTEEEYNGMISLIVTSVKPRKIDIGKFLPTSKVGADTLKTRFTALIKTITKQPLQSLLHDTVILLDDFWRCPGASVMHHAYVGGLAQHTLGVTSLVDEGCRMFHGLDRDIAITGAMLHDIGKVWEYELAPGFPRTLEGQLEGHIALGLSVLMPEMVQRLDEKTLLHLRHILLSHHGKLEWGSPVEPRTAEALLVFQSDYFDSRMAGVTVGLNDVNPGEWTKGPIGVVGSKMLKL